MRVPFNDLGLHHRQLKPALDSAIQSVVDRSAFVSGAEIEEFERSFSRYCGVSSGVACNSGTDAIELALRAVGIESGDDVILPAHTFIASAEPVCLLGANPIVVDVDPGTYTIDPQAVEAAVTSRTKAIIAVHIYGQPCDMEALNGISVRHGLKLIEDAAQAHGATFKGRRTGSLGDVACFSFYPGKNLGAFGDAGIVLSDDGGVIEFAYRMRDHGRLPNEKFASQMIGRNCRMDTLQAAVLNVKLPHLDTWIARRRDIAAIYDSNIAGLVKTQAPQEDAEHVYHVYSIETDRRDWLRAELGKRGIASGIHYPQPVHLHQSVRDICGYKEGSCPVAENICNRTLSLPIYPEMTDDQVGLVIETLREILGG